MIIAGVMSGSSLDGLDIALVEFFGDGKWDLIETFDLLLPVEILDKIKNYHLLSVHDYIRFTYDFSFFIGESLNSEFTSRESKVDYISFHGHTLVHNPSAGFTEQIGNGATIAGVTGIPTITEFRNQDIVHGGQGTPLAPIADITLFRGYDYYLNLGGIANITCVADDNVIAYDICPCNQILNHYSRKLGYEYDDNGTLAARGKNVGSISQFLDTISYFKQDAPKSIDNNWIKDLILPQFPDEEAADVLHSYCQWMAKHIAFQIQEKDISQRLFVTGGGAHNGFFMKLLKDELSKRGCELVIPSTQIVDFKEAVLMALLGWKYLNDETNVLSSVTGAKKDTIGGSLHKC